MFGQRASGLGEYDRFAKICKGHVIEPGLAASEQNHPDIDRCRVLFDIADDLVILPLAEANRPISHVVEETNSVLTAVNPHPELGTSCGLGSFNPDSGSEAHAMATDRRGVEGLHEIPEGRAIGSSVGQTAKQGGAFPGFWFLPGQFTGIVWFGGRRPTSWDLADLTLFKIQINRL